MTDTEIIALLWVASVLTFSYLFYAHGFHRGRMSQMAQNDRLAIDKRLPCDHRPPKSGWAPGNYECNCHGCGKSFLGDKRALACADCAYAELPRQKPLPFEKPKMPPFDPRGGKLFTDEEVEEMKHRSPFTLATPIKPEPRQKK